MYKIAVIAGDGTGPEVVAEAKKVLSAVQNKFNIQFQFTDMNYNGERYLKEGKTLSEDELEGLKTYDAILLGAIGHTDIKPGIMERGVLLKLRFGLDLFINLRPVKLYENVETPIKNIKPNQIDYVVVRENVGGLYSGIGGFSMKGTQNEVAEQAMVYTRFQVERCIRYAFEHARKRHAASPWKGLSEKEKADGIIGKVTLCGKTNVLTHVFDLWERTVNEVGQDYPDIKTDYVHVDACCIYMIECPERFDVIVTGNMFGDIITDLAAVTQGGMGVAPGANINPDGVSMFEPIGGTAPAFTGLNQINPMACIGSAQMMLDHLNETKAAKAVETAMVDVFKIMKSQAAGKMGYSTTEIGDLVAERI
ncbi:3-isopropylmalate dehydrogenase [Thermoproteota archaeon]